MKNVLKLALEALNEWGKGFPDLVGDLDKQAISAIKEALAQEPFEYWNAVEGWVKIDEVRDHMDSVGCGTIYKTAGEDRVPLCIAQRTWVNATTWRGLTIEDKKEYVAQDFGGCRFDAMDWAEKRLKEKNT